MAIEYIPAESCRIAEVDITPLQLLTNAWYDYGDHTFNRDGVMICADTMEILADENVDQELFHKTTWKRTELVRDGRMGFIIREV